jgi:hypothetical protein
LFRRARFETLSALFIQTGGQAMATFITFPRFYYGSDPSTQEFEYNFHFWAGTVVKDPKLITWCDHVQIVGYGGGWGMQPVLANADEYADAAHSSAAYPYAGDIFVVEEPYESISYPERMPITGRRGDYFPAVQRSTRDLTNNMSLTYANAYAANLLYRWIDVQTQTEADEAVVPHERSFLEGPQLVFPMAQRGTARFFGEKTGKKWLHRSRGYFPSEIVGPTMLDVLNGGLESFPHENLADYLPLV